MNLIFDKAGQYKNDFKVMEVTEDHVKAGTVFKVDESNGTDYVKVKCAHVADEPEEVETAIDKMTVAQLDEFAAGLEPVIDLSEVKNKVEKLAAIKAELEIRMAALEATKTDD